MSQFARPVSDLATGAWSPTPVWSRLDEVVPSDADFVSDAEDGTIGVPFQVSLNTISDPGKNLSHIIHVRLRESNTSQFGFEVELLQGASHIASFVPSSG